jgi:hypothetical protein
LYYRGGARLKNNDRISLYSLVLHFNKGAPELTEADVKRLIKGLLDTLRIGAKTKGWSYWIWVAYSEENLRSLKKADRHIHIVLYCKGALYGKNGIIDSIKHYWIPPTPKARKKGDKPAPKRQRWGKVCNREVYNTIGFLGYIKSQSSFTVREQKSIGADIDLPLERIQEYEISKAEYDSKYKTS